GRIDKALEVTKQKEYGVFSDQQKAKLRENVTRIMVEANEPAFEQAVAHDWEKYTKELNLAKRQAFHQKYADFCAEVAKKLEQLAQFRVSWLQERRFITCCRDFYSTRLADNLNYREAVDYAMASLNITETGSAFLDRLIDQYSTLSESNIVWRSLLLNHPDVMAEMSGFLQQMAMSKGDVKPANIEKFMGVVSSLSGKLVEAYDKANEALEKPLKANSSFARAMLHCDRRLVTLGDRFFNFTRLGKVLNSRNEMLSKTLFSVISGVPFDQAVELSVSQLKDGDEFRQQVLKALKASGSDARLETKNNYNRDFKEFAQSAEGEPALKQSRIKLLVLIFNGLEFANQLKESQGDTKDHAQVTAAFLGTLSTAVEIVTPAVEHGIKNVAATDSIKFIGASAGTVASALNFGVDISDAFSEWYGQRRWQFIGLYGLKGAADFMQFTKALNGLLKVLVERALLAPKNLLLEGTARLLAWEYLAWLCSWEAMLVIFIIEELVTYFSDNELQKWCRNCVFGLEPAKSLKSTQFIDSESQRNTLYEAQRKGFANAMKDLS
ncbi:T6SS effector BTH_I2691 family protein, partial [Photorhabdus viridis]|uniref:T6SS effector BTH_I2691 family protein n=2 Tax=Photorhabdus viridis TaxID=3163327 RepID=UPI00330720F2